MNDENTLEVVENEKAKPMKVRYRNTLSASLQEDAQNKAALKRARKVAKNKEAL